MVPLSVLDLVPVKAGHTPGEALRESLDLIRRVEGMGYRRYWVAEHHNMVGIASAATSVVIGHLAQGSQTIRVGSGGIMLPNHSPLLIAEQFGTLESLFPGRIDLGLGRAPGTDKATLRALRRHGSEAEDFPQDVRELQSLLAPVKPGQTVQAVPGAGTQVPLWILGSSLYGAHLAAEMGLPYAFASHFAPQACLAALKIYRSQFKPSTQLSKPYAMVGINAVAAESRKEARRLFTSLQQAFVHLFRGNRGYCAPPIEDIEAYWAPEERAQVNRMLEYSIVGDREDIAIGLGEILERTRADELMVSSHICHHPSRVASYALLAEVAESIMP